MTRMIFTISGITLAVGFASAAVAKDRDFHFARHDGPVHLQFVDDDWEDYWEDREEYFEDLRERREEYYEELRERREDAREELEEFYEDRAKHGRWAGPAWYFDRYHYAPGAVYSRPGFRLKFYHSGTDYLPPLVPRYYYYHPHPQYCW